ncbi:cysteine peptidase family C39 domain-containing protein [Cerasicoccus maritimus]|uniref:cysteine peptidase family C39 domain-containing protein n=1 Tax=Cerasicoccus maritimus TaxID=490089 RepID=UPI002852A051|nr:cysteine peptidase family C39 domain-containing protein [Cerasicoccus maritimus]
MLIIAAVSLLYGVGAALIASRQKRMKLALFSPIAFAGGYLLFALGIIFLEDFRILFPYSIQVYGSTLIGKTLLASSFILVGWLVVDAFMEKKREYVPLCIVLIIGIPTVYLRTFATDLSALSSTIPRDGYLTQSTDYSCSAASVANLCFSLLKTPISEKEAAEMMRLSKFGGSVCQIGYALEQNGLLFKEIDAKPIEEVSFPAILVVNYGKLQDGHAILVLENRNEKFLVLDPLMGKEEARSAIWFHQNWNGLGIEDISNQAQVAMP